MKSLRIRAAAALALAVALPLAATACGGGGGGGASDTIVIGTKFDQPGLGLKNPDGTMSGFDVDVATYVAKELGYAPDKIEWKESPSAQRETLIQNDQVSSSPPRTRSPTPARKRSTSPVRTWSPGSPCWSRPTTPISPARSRCRTTRSCARCRVRRRRNGSRTSTPACSCSSTTPIRRASRR